MSTSQAHKKLCLASKIMNMCASAVSVKGGVFLISWDVLFEDL